MNFYQIYPIFRAFSCKLRPTKPFYIKLQPAEYFFFKMWPSDEFEFETPVIDQEILHNTIKILM